MTDFLTADTNLPSYMMFPRFLLDMEINETAKMLYMILLDRARLSQKNEGWSDTNGHVFLYFTIEALAEVLHKSQMTVKTALAVLEKQELIFRKRQGPGQPNRIYVKLPKETIHYTDRFLSLRQTKNCPIDRQDSFPDTDRKLSGNKKEIKKNNLAIRGSKEPLSPYGKFQNVFLSEKELEDIRQTIPDWKDYIERLSGYMALDRSSAASDVYKRQGVKSHAHPMEHFKMFFCQRRSWKISGRQSLTGRTIWNAYPVIWLLPESNTKTMQLPSSVGQDRIILFPGNEIMKVRNTKHYDNIYRKTNSYHTKQRASV